MHFFIYSRKSVSSLRGDSVENQVRLCENYIFSRFKDTENIEISVYEDDGFSAKTTARPEFLKMQRDLKTMNPDFVVCYRLDRISRNVGDFSQFIESLICLNIGFICINEDFDTSKPMGKAMMFITSVFAQLERETIAERVKDNMLMLAKNGQWLGGTAPLGFESKLFTEKRHKKQKSACYLKAIPDEAKKVSLIFASFKRLKSYNAIATELLQKGILNRNKNTFTAAAVKQILKNPVYASADKSAFEYFKRRGAQLCFSEAELDNNIGLIAYNKRNYSKKGCKVQDESRWIVAKGKHSPILSGKDWVEVQNIINKRSTGKINREYSLLSGVIYCKKCNGRMVVKRRSGKGFDYICETKLKGTKALCDNKNLCGETVDEAFFDKLFLEVFDIKDFEKLSFNDKRQIIDLAVSRIEWDGERIHCYLR